MGEQAMHDNPALWPQLPPRTDPSEAADLILDSVRGTEWQTCWEFMLSHDLTAAEGSAFWHGANLAMKAAMQTPPDPPTSPAAGGGVAGAT